MTITTGAIRSAPITSAASMPVTPGMLMSMKTMSGDSDRAKLDRLGAVAGLGDDLVALLLEHLAEIHPDERLVLGDEHAHAAHSSIVVVGDRPGGFG